MNSIALTIISIIVFGYLTNAQEVISSAGNTYSDEEHKVSWTLGEPVIKTIKGANNILTQGFHQTNLTVTALDNLNFPGLELSVYPNPVKHILNIKASGSGDIKLQLRLFGIDGKQLLQKEVMNNLEEINMFPYAGGNYLLKISTTGDAPVRIFKIVKR